MVVWAQHAEVSGPGVGGIAVDMIDFDQHATVLWMTLVPAALLACVIGASENPLTNPRLQFAGHAGMSCNVAYQPSGNLAFAGASRVYCADPVAIAFCSAPGDLPTAELAAAFPITAGIRPA